MAEVGSELSCRRLIFITYSFRYACCYLAWGQTVILFFFLPKTSWKLQVLFCPEVYLLQAILIHSTVTFYVSVVP